MRLLGRSVRLSPLMGQKAHRLLKNPARLAHSPANHGALGHGGLVTLGFHE